MGVEGVGTSSTVGLAMLENQQLLVKEGQTNRDMAYELGKANKKLEGAFEGMEHFQRKTEEVTRWISAASSVVGVVESAVGVKSSAGQQHELDQLSGAAREQKMQEIVEGANNPQDSTLGAIKRYGMASLGAGTSVANDQSKQMDDAMKKWGEALKETSKSDLELSADIKRTVDKERELTGEMFKLGSVFRAKMP